MSSSGNRKRLLDTSNHDYTVKVNKCDNIRQIYDESVEYSSDKHIGNKSGKASINETRESTINRHLVNHIRHQYTNYTELLKHNGLYYADKNLYHNCKNLVLKEIANEYPFLESECNAQKHLVVMVKKVKRKHNYFLSSNKKSNSKSNKK